MNTATEATQPSGSLLWSEYLAAHARQYPLIIAGLDIALLAVLGLLVQSLFQTLSGGGQINVRNALLGGLPQRIEDVMPAWTPSLRTRTAAAAARYGCSSSPSPCTTCPRAWPSA